MASSSSTSADQQKQLLTFEIVPELCLRNEQLELVLGTPINQIITGIQNVYRTIKNVELAYCNKEPFGRDITLTLRNNGIRLHFDAHRQLLKMIELFEFSHVELHYSHSIFSTPDEPADVGRVERCFGATVPGVYDEKQQKYFLHWRGVSFCFPAQNSSSSVQASYAHGLGSLSFASSALPQLERMTIFAGPSPAKMRVPDIPMVVYCGNPHLILAESLSDDQGRLLGMRIKFSIEDVTENSTEDLHLIQLERDIFFNDTQQEVMTKLGAPAKIYYKSEEKMLIQRRQGAAAGPERLRERGSEEGEEEMPDFFFNYFSLGMGIDKNRDYLVTRISIRDKLLSQEIKQLEQNLRELPTCKLTFPSTSKNGDVEYHEMDLTVKPNTGLYKGGVFKFKITVPPEYNNVPPIVKCLTRVWHPNINEDGSICLSLLRQNSLDGFGWMPTRRIHDVILGLDQLFTDLIDFDDPLNAQAAQQYQSNKEAFAQKVKEYIGKYCTRN